MGGDLRAGVIGAGVLGTLHAQKYATTKGVALAGVADIALERAQNVTARYGGLATRAYEELLPCVDVVSIAVPTVSHYPVARACLEAGVHVLVEKPITPTLDEADALVALAESRGLCLGVGHLERFNPAYARLAGELPDPVFVQAERLARFQHRGTDVDVVLDLMIHDLDLVLATIKSDVVGVSACGFDVMTGSIDIANAYIEFASGAVANLSASRISREPVRKLRVFGHNAYASLDLRAPQLRLERVDAGGDVQPLVWKPDHADALRTEIEAFVAGVMGRGTSFVTGREGRRALELALRVNQAVAERVERRAAQTRSCS
jgi:predicted dehydrogenase